MKIAASQVQLSGHGVHRFEQTRREALSAWNQSQRLNFFSESSVRSTSATFSADRATLSDQARALAADQAQSLDGAAEAAGVNVQDLLGSTAALAKAKQAKSSSSATSYDPIYELKVLLIEALTGRKVILFDPSRFAKNREEAEQNAAATADRVSAGQQTAQNGEPQRVGWGVSYQYHEETREVEEASFEAKGVVRTADGKEIAFSASVEMSRESVSVVDFSLRAGDALTDPLVINFSGTAAELTDEKMSFDLNGDGSSERVSFLKSGSGFLVLDRNGDGQVNNGLELFGPKTGNGFAELATYDEDQNGWIDESDSVFSNLRVWTKDEQNTDLLSTLAEKNVGAIYLKSASTPFNLNDTQGDTAGKLRTTGVYLTEDGQAQTIQQVDLVT